MEDETSAFYPNFIFSPAAELQNISICMQSVLRGGVTDGSFRDV